MEKEPNWFIVKEIHKTTFIAGNQITQSFPSYPNGRGNETDNTKYSVYLVMECSV